MLSVVFCSTKYYEAIEQALNDRDNLISSVGGALVS